MTRKGAYTRKQGRSSSEERSHQAGNPRKAVVIRNVGKGGFKEAMRKFFDERETGQPSVSKILQSRGVEIGVTKWVRRK